MSRDMGPPPSTSGPTLSSGPILQQGPQMRGPPPVSMPQPHGAPRGMFSPPDGGPRGLLMQPRPQMRPMGPPDHRGPPPLMLQKIERPPGLGGPRPDSPMNDDSEGSSQPPPEEKKPEEMKLPSALEKVLAFKDMRAQEVGLTPEELEQLDKPEGIYEPFHETDYFNRPPGYKTFFMLSSTEQEISIAHKN